jgi:putative ABC transport system permease protein
MAPGTTAAESRTEIERALDGFAGAKVMDRSEALANARAQVNRFIVPVGALLAFSVLIALLGIANTLFLSVQERLRELTVLRAIGMARSQVRSMIRTEALIVAALGSTLGAGLAVFLGWALVTTMGDVGVSHTVVPAGQLAGLVAAASLAGVAAGTWPARRAARLALP